MCYMMLCHTSMALTGFIIAIGGCHAWNMTPERERITGNSQGTVSILGA